MLFEDIYDGLEVVLTKDLSRLPDSEDVYQTSKLPVGTTGAVVTPPKEKHKADKNHVFVSWNVAPGTPFWNFYGTLPDRTGFFVKASFIEPYEEDNFSVKQPPSSLF